jgi:hypothetical protein
MNKTSGLILEIYDDQEGSILRQVFPTAESVPEMIKNAHCLTERERDSLPDDLFALILVNGDTSLRKYACVDAGNTALSVEYFLKTRDKLPVEAQKVAASNLLTSCSWYGINPPEELQKVALGPLDLAIGAITVPGAIKETKANLKAVRGPMVVTPAQRKELVQASGFPQQ